MTVQYVREGTIYDGINYAYVTPSSQDWLHETAMKELYTYRPCKKCLIIYSNTLLEVMWPSGYNLLKAFAKVTPCYM